MTGVGVMALDEGGRVDFGRLRAERRARVDAVMDDLGVDVLVLGREYNARYATGSRRLSVAGTRPFGPGCIVVRATGDVHVMTTWDEGIPTDIPHEHLYGMSWNPLNTVEALKQMPGVAGARRVGIDAMTPLFAGLLPMAMPDATLVDVESALRATRMRKTTDEVACIRTAVAIAESAMVATAHAIRPGAHERALLGVFEERMAALGATVPTMEGTFCVVDGAATATGLRRLVSDRAVGLGDLVATCSAVLYGGYEGWLGRTWPCLGAAWPRPRRRDATSTAAGRWCATRSSRRAGRAPPAPICRAAHEAAGEPLPSFPIARSIGLGYEAPIAGTSLGADFDRRWTLEAGFVLALETFVAGPGGGYLGGETVLVGDDGPEVLSTLGNGVLDDRS